MTDISDPPSNESEPNGRCICVADCKYFEYTGVKVLISLSTSFIRARRKEDVLSQLHLRIISLCCTCSV